MRSVQYNVVVVQQDKTGLIAEEDDLTKEKEYFDARTIIVIMLYPGGKSVT